MGEEGKGSKQNEPKEYGKLDLKGRDKQVSKSNE
jgi:hypothetical protein